MQYTVKRSSRRTMALEITGKCEAIVRAPYRADDGAVRAFVEKNRVWIEQTLALQQKRAKREREIDVREEELRLAAKSVLPALTAHWAVTMGLTPSSVKITSAKTRFGSCSSKNGICFSWRLMAYPDAAIEYVVVHELAHIRYHNHSAAFYRLIGRYLPDYQERKKLLKNT